MDAPETKSEISSSDESQDDNINEVQPTEEVAPEAIRPEYQPGELSQLVNYLKDMVVLFDLRPCDWNAECLNIVERWFLEHHHPLLFIFYTPDNVLTASLATPLIPYHDATYFLRQPNEIFQVATFHDTIQYGTIHDPDESLLVLMEAIYAPHFFNKPLDWSERVRVSFLEAIDNFLIDVTDLHYKIGGLTVLAMPPVLQDHRVDMEDEFTVRRLEKLIIHWMGQIRLFLGDNEPKELLCPSDYYDFWVYRDEVLQGLILQFDRPEVQTVLRVLEQKQSIYIKQFQELVEDCGKEVDRTTDNIKYLSLLVEPSTQLEACQSPSEIPPLLPEIIRLILYIQQRSKYLKGVAVVDLFRSLTNHVILYCRSRIHITEILETCPREGIKLCSMSIDCCLAYRIIYEEIIDNSDSDDLDLDEQTIFNPIETFVERLHDLLLICEYCEINAMEAPQFGGTWAHQFEVTCSEMSRIFNTALEQIKSNQHLALDVTGEVWSSTVMVQFKGTLRELDEIFQNMIRTAFIACRNIDDQVELLCTLINYQKRDTLTNCFIEYTATLDEAVLQEVMAIKAFILEERTKKRRYALCERYSGLGMFLLANLKRTQRLKNLVKSLHWLRQDPPENVRLELDILENLIQQDIQANFEEWKASIPDNMINSLQRSLLVRSLSRPGLLECNIDRQLVVLLKEATAFKRLHFATPINITQLFTKCAQVCSLFESSVTMCLDYNLIIVSLTEKERLLFRPLIRTCDKKITVGIYKSNWAGELTDNYTTESLQLTCQIQDFLASYKVANMRIVQLCEEICDQEILCLPTRDLQDLATIEDRVAETRRSGCTKLMNLYRDIVEQIVAVHNGFASYTDGPLLVVTEGVNTMTTPAEVNEWCEYVKKIDKLLERAFCHCLQQNLKTIVQQLCGASATLHILPFVKVQVVLDGDSLVFHPELGRISLFFGSLYSQLLSTFKLFKRLHVHLRIPQRDGAVISSYYDVLKANGQGQSYQRKIVDECRAAERDVASYAVATWSPFQSQWSMDKEEFLHRFDATQPRPENFNSIIGKYAEIANQISVQTDDDSRLSIRYVQLNVTALKASLIRHIDEWQRLHIALLLKRSCSALDEIYAGIAQLTKDIDVQPKNREEMMTTLKLQERIQLTEVPGMEKRFAEARNHFRVMDINNIEVPLEYQKKLKGLDGEWEVFLEKLKDAVETLQTSKDQFG